MNSVTQLYMHHATLAMLVQYIYRLITTQDNVCDIIHHSRRRDRYARTSASISVAIFVERLVSMHLAISAILFALSRMHNSRLE